MTPGALAIVMVILSVRRGSSGAVAGTKPATLGGRKAMKYCLFVLFLFERNSQGRFLQVRKKKIKLTEQANRGNVKDCFDPFGTKSSPRKVRVPGSHAVATPASASVSLSNLSEVAPILCRQNTALATLERNMLLLRRAPRSSAASEPIAMVRRRHKLGALATMSSTCASVPWRVRNRGIGELLANVS